MRRLVAVELLKLRTVGTLSRFVALALVLVLAATLSAMASADFDRPPPVRSGAGFRVHGPAAAEAAVSNRDDARKVALGWTLVPLLALALGVVAAGGERQHRTLPTAVLAVPRRGRLVTAKVLACLPLAAGMVVLGLAVDLVLAVPWLDSQGASADLSATTWALVVAGGLLAALGAAALGVAIGFLTPFPATGIVFGVGFVLVVEPVVASRAPDLALFLPGYAMAALVRGLTTTAHDEVLPQAVGALVLAVWVCLLLAAATRWLTRRDLV
jgi:ABC-2 type transport system permease protein